MQTKDVNEYLIDTDILVEHLTNRKYNELSILESLMIDGICFTTVLNASEIFYRSENETNALNIKSLLSALKILGLHSRYSLNISDFFNKVANVRDALMCVTAKINRLPIVTLNEKRYKNSSVKIINPLKMRGKSDTRKSYRDSLVN
ncbi:MAG: type II toxin-antitoxin system VapC family toxin [Ignavibacteria bacterium]|nr:type II toxin-antitoxin system VapC family toxin [Ignavibacteria bacterium]